MTGPHPFCIAMLGIYLKEPHGRLIADGKKTAIAHAVGSLDIVGQRVLCTKEDGEGKALGILTVGGPVEVSLDDFDTQAATHLVSQKERLQWWPLRKKLWLYPVESFEPFEEVKEVDVDGVPIDMGDVAFVQEQSEVQYPHSPGECISGEKGENQMPWKVFKEGDEFCVYKLDAEGNKTGKSRGCHPTKDKASAQMRALYAAEGRGEMKSIEDGTTTENDVNVSESGQKYYSVGVPYGVTSFTQLAALEEAYEKVATIQRRANQFPVMVEYIYADSTIENKEAAVATLAKEFAEIVEEPADEDKSYETDEIDEEEGLKAKWERASINNLPDSAFLHIQDGGEKDEEGKTKPRSLRHFPYKDASGEVDLPHLRNAISRLGQPATGKDWLSEDLRKKLLAKARSILAKHGGGEGEDKEYEAKGWLERIGEAISEGVKRVFADRQTGAEIDLQAIHDKLDTGEKSAAFAFKGKDGKTYWMQWTTNAFRDREGEIFTTKSIDDYVEQHEKDTKKGEFWFWHIPGTKFADVTWQARVGRFLVQLGPFDDTEIGNAFKEFFTQHPNGHDEFALTGWGASHGYEFKPEDRKDAVYDWFDIKESTVLPEHLAANQYNPAPGVLTEEKMITQEQRKALETILGEGAADKIEKLGEAKTKALEQAEIAYKAVDESPMKIFKEGDKFCVYKLDAEGKKTGKSIGCYPTVEEAKAKVAEAKGKKKSVEPETEAETPVAETPVAETLPAAEPVEPVAEEVEVEVEAEAETEVEVEAEVEAEAIDEGKQYSDVKEAIVTIAEAIKGIRDQVQTLSDEVQNMKRSDDERVAERIAGIPGASLKSLIEDMVSGKSAIGNQSTHVDGRDALVRSKAKLPQELADKQDEGAVSLVPKDWLGG